MEGREREREQKARGTKELSPPHALLAYSFSWMKDIISTIV
jgi:hypothetical protein